MYHKLKILTLNTSHTFDTDPSKLINNKFGDNRHLTQSASNIMFNFLVVFIAKNQTFHKISMHEYR